MVSRPFLDDNHPVHAKASHSQRLQVAVVAVVVILVVILVVDLMVVFLIIVVVFVFRGLVTNSFSLVHMVLIGVHIVLYS